MKKLLAMVLALVMTLSLAVSANAALVKGCPDGTFKPSGKVTGYEVLAMNPPRGWLRQEQRVLRR